MNRRWTELRRRMEREGIEFLVVEATQRYLGGYLRWLVDIPATNNLSQAVLGLDGNATLVTHGPPGTAPPEEQRSNAPLDTVRVPAFPSVWWQDGWQGEKVADVIGRSRPHTVGLVGLGTMSASLYENLKKELPSSKFVNASPLVDEVKMIKSDEEMKLLTETAELHETSYQVAKKALRLGRTPLEAIHDIRTQQILEGSEEQQLFIRFGPPGEPTLEQHSAGNWFVRRAFRQGDIVDVLIESSGRGGYWYDLRRVLCFGSPSKELVDAHDISREAGRVFAAACKSGAKCGDALRASDDYLISRKCPRESRICGHGQGADLVERPLIRAEEDVRLEEGMVLALHPTAKISKTAVSLSDDYRVTPSGSVPLSSSLHQDDEIEVL